MILRSRILLFMIAMFCILENGFSQTFSDYKWEGDMPKSAEIPAQFKGEDAVIFRSETFSQSIFTGSFPEIDQVATYKTYEHTVILKEEALKEFNRLSIPKFSGRIGDFVQVKFVDVRIRKKDGNVIDLKVRDLPIADLKEDDPLYESREENYIYEIKNLEVGDEIEQVSVIESKFPDQGRVVNLYKNYPVLDASFVISVSNMVKVNGRVYNGMPQPVIAERGEQRNYTWRMQNLRAVPEANSGGTIFTKSLEYFVYELNLDAFRMDPLTVKISNFSDLIMQYVQDFVEPKVRNKKKYKEFYENLFAKGAKALGKADATTLSKLEKVFIFNEFIVKELKVINRLEDFERSEGIDYFLNNKKADYANLMCIYRDFFEKNEIAYYLAVGKSRFDGDFDVEYVSSTQIASYLFVITVEDGKTFSLAPGAALDEMPSNLMKTKCLLKNIADPKSKLQSIEYGDETLKDDKNNKRTRRTEIQIAENGDTEIKSSINLSGLYSTEGRAFWLSAVKEDSVNVRLIRNLKNRFKDKEIQIKNASMKKMDVLAPYPFEFEYTATVKGLFEFKDGKLQLKAKDWIGHSIRWIQNSKKRTLDFENQFTGVDIDEVILKFPFPVQMENVSELAKSLDNEFAAYKLTVSPVNESTIRIQSRYAIKQLQVPAAKATVQQAVNEVWEKANDAKWNLKKK
jgi:hypothetical protein